MGLIEPENSEKYLRNPSTTTGCVTPFTANKRHLRSRNGVICRRRSVIGGVHCWQQSADNRRITIGRWSLTNTLSEEPAVHAEHARTPSHTLLHYVHKIMTPYHTHLRLQRKEIALDTFVPAISSLVKHRFLFYVICPYKVHTTNCFKWVYHSNKHLLG